MITVVGSGVQGGGGSGDKILMAHIYPLRKCLDKYTHKSYSDIIMYIDFGFFIDGSLAKFGFLGAKKPKYHKRSKALSVDIGITEEFWRKNTSSIKQFIVDEIANSLTSMIMIAKINDVNFKENEFVNDVGLSLEEFQSHDVSIP